MFKNLASIRLETKITFKLVLYTKENNMRLYHHSFLTNCYRKKKNQQNTLITHFSSELKVLRTRMVRWELLDVKIHTHVLKRSWRILLKMHRVETSSPALFQRIFDYNKVFPLTQFRKKGKFTEDEIEVIDSLCCYCYHWVFLDNEIGMVLPPAPCLSEMYLVCKVFRIHMIEKLEKYHNS